MNPQWDTPPNGDFASHVERLAAQAMRAVAASAQRAGFEQAEECEALLQRPAAEQAAIRARAPSAVRGQQLQSEHPLVHGLKLALKKLEISLHEAAQRKK